MMKLPTIGENRAKLTAIIAAGVPLTVIAWAAAVFMEKGITAQDAVTVLAGLGGPLGYLLGKESGGDA